jgi:hypothetical protein
MFEKLKSFATSIANNDLIPFFYDRKNKEYRGIKFSDFKTALNIPGSLPYTSYTALITQIAGAPTAIVLENSLGADITYAKDSSGLYIATDANNSFTAGKTAFIIGNTSEENIFTAVVESTITTNEFYFSSANAADSLADGLFVNTILEIRVYN